MEVSTSVWLVEEHIASEFLDFALAVTINQDGEYPKVIAPEQSNLAIKYFEQRIRFRYIVEWDTSYTFEVIRTETRDFATVDQHQDKVWQHQSHCAIHNIGADLIQRERDKSRSHVEFGASLYSTRWDDRLVDIGSSGFSQEEAQARFHSLFSRATDEVVDGPARAMLEDNTEKCDLDELFGIVEYCQNLIAIATR